MMRRPVAIVFGGTRIGNRELFKPETTLESFLDILRAHGITTIDTAQAYGNSEAALGAVRAGERFTLDTKWSPYNPLSRDKETALFPTLRKLGMAFYAFGPSAGGFLGKTVAQAQEIRNSNMDAVSAACKPFLRDARYLNALAQWNALAERESMSAAEMAYRWMAHHSALDGNEGDGVIIGTSSLKQLEETLGGIERGPLSDEACDGIQQIWESVAQEA
ncbi:hypothetical protein LLEC1_02857 [Akanthomyces lecanii]|uniref:NADP-dependent oxidoreductase domain-containing protein n=1 Tax=Cordyceps confragosa TaxID=2714763 RepID=A0A179I196_CORDF|nr:hypothetical protein LLEC1_02857 [Akanthomyces lecanii]